jgi:ankyrin repeat protein
VVQLLLAAGANVNAAEQSGETPLYAAAQGGHSQVMQLLLAAGANVNAADSSGWTQLYAAAQLGHIEVVQQLLRRRANPQLRNEDGHTAVWAAAFMGYEGIVQLLLEAWGQPEIPAADLVAAAKVAAGNKHATAFARLAKELRRLYPAEVQQLFEGENSVSAVRAAKAVLDAWASDVSSLDEQRAAVRKKEADVAEERQALQQLMVGMAGMAKQAQQDLAKLSQQSGRVPDDGPQG